MWPPVPPPAISRRMGLLVGPLDGLPRDREEDAGSGEADDERRAAGADEREGDPGHRQQGDDDADVDERLEAEPGGDARGEERPERVRRPERRPDPGVGEDEEEDDDRRRPEEPELLADDREDEVVPGVRQVEAAGELALAEAGPEDPAEP